MKYCSSPVEACKSQIINFERMWSHTFFLILELGIYLPNPDDLRSNSTRESQWVFTPVDYAVGSMCE